MKNRRLHRQEAQAICDLRYQMSAEQVGEQYGVSADCVNLIWTGLRWKEINHPLQGRTSKPRLTDVQNQHLKSLKGSISAKDASLMFSISIKRVEAVWRE